MWVSGAVLLIFKQELIKSWTKRVIKGSECYEYISVACKKASCGGIILFASRIVPGLLLGWWVPPYMYRRGLFPSNDMI